MQYVISDADRLRDRQAFTHHAPHGDQVERYGLVRWHLRETAEAIREMAPPSRELSLSITKLEEAMFWANAAIARNEPPPAKDP